MPSHWVYQILNVESNANGLSLPVIIYDFLNPTVFQVGGGVDWAELCWSPRENTSFMTASQSGEEDLLCNV